MADLTKTVGIVFEGDTEGAESKIEGLATAVASVGDDAKTASLAGVADKIKEVGDQSDGSKDKVSDLASNVTSVGDPSKIGGITDAASAIKDVGEAAKGASDQSSTLSGSVKTLTDGMVSSATAASNAASKVKDAGNSAKDAADNTGLLVGAIKAFLDGAGLSATSAGALATALASIGAPAIGAAAVATIAIGGFALAAIEGTRDSEDFKNLIENLTGSSTRAKDELDFLKTAVSNLQKPFSDVADAYATYLTKLEGTSIPMGVARDAFTGIVESVIGVGGSLTTAGTPLKNFIDAAKDGNISLTDLETKISTIPGGLTLFAGAMNTSVDGLKNMASEGWLGKDAIEAFATALGSVEKKDLSPVSSAFTDLWETIKSIAKEKEPEQKMGEIERSIRELTALIAVSSGAFTFVNDAFKALNELLKTGDISTFMDKINDAYKRFIDRIDPSLSKLNGIKSWAESVGISFKSINDNPLDLKLKDADIARFADLGTKVKSTDELLKALGVNPEKVKIGVDEITAMFVDLAGRPDVKGETLLSAFESTVKRIKSEDQLSALIVDWITAFGNGKISAEQFATGLGAAQTQQLAIAKATGDATPKIDDNKAALDRATKAANDATKAANDFAVKMEEIASKERIKLIEAKVTLSVAEVEANAKIAVAAFDSINKTVDSTGKTLVDLLGLLRTPSVDWTAWRTLMTEIDKESARRDAALAKQNEMFDAQIANWKARTEAMARGDALIKIDGSGLSPHLEAFMWEILRAIQVRVAKDGLEMLTGF